MRGRSGIQTELGSSSGGGGGLGGGASVFVFGGKSGTLTAATPLAGRFTVNSDYTQIKFSTTDKNGNATTALANYIGSAITSLWGFTFVLVKPVTGSTDYLFLRAFSPTVAGTGYYQFTVLNEVAGNPMTIGDDILLFMSITSLFADPQPTLGTYLNVNGNFFYDGVGVLRFKVDKYLQYILGGHKTNTYNFVLYANTTDATPTTMLNAYSLMPTPVAAASNIPEMWTVFGTITARSVGVTGIAAVGHVYGGNANNAASFDLSDGTTTTTFNFISNGAGSAGTQAVLIFNNGGATIGTFSLNGQTVNFDADAVALQAALDAAGTAAIASGSLLSGGNATITFNAVGTQTQPTTINIDMDAGPTVVSWTDGTAAVISNNHDMANQINGAGMLLTASYTDSPDTVTITGSIFSSAQNVPIVIDSGGITADGMSGGVTAQNYGIGAWWFWGRIGYGSGSSGALAHHFNITADSGNTLTTPTLSDDGTSMTISVVGPVANNCEWSCNMSAISNSGT